MPKITPGKLLFILLLALLLLILSMPIQPCSSAYAAKADVEYWAVIVGVADYPGWENDLDYTDDDAYDVHDTPSASITLEENRYLALTEF